MFLDKEPYFMKNDDWYYFDGENEMYKPTPIAPPKAIKSIEDFNKKHTGYDEDGNKWSDF